ncbi:baseplate multidomain protein megatron [Aquisalinus flavus]|uniref:Phage host specificity protein n=1 Tax=Aquisalinus flavus TaxID=1526572 RepID=A0A8J2V2E5_9PROT|nr:glycoside hydrolase/phage tail family protein [Aquisalinus flavus]MBD0426296.1 glycoside hydrolase/phage tail family protein [Aquisalinus flavus]UNE48136.1 hypothetical protein FF099_08775 [Aquisalinus flavus]GGD09089.1 phage host specificity protein [Aquisalinus flavus]
MSQLVVTAGRLAGGAASSLGRGLASGIARGAAAYVTGQAENLIYGPARRRRTGPQVEAFRLQTASEGTPIPAIYGRARLSGEIIWASDFLETVATDTTTTGGKGGGASRPVETTTTTWLYSVSLAIGLCEGEISRIGRVWADGKPVSLQDYTYRLYTGAEDQLPDSAIEAVEGAGLAPAYRGLAYIVFEDLPLAAFGNRVPQFSFEIERPLADENGASLENVARAVCLIPGSGESAYATTPVLVDDGEGATRQENVNNNAGGTDLVASVRALTETLPACSKVALIVSWFGTDLRAGFCEVRPGVELLDKETTPFQWSVGGTTREDAHVVSTVDGRPAYGGTPSDRSVVEAIRHLTAQGFEVLFYPFILMDIAPGNALPDPDSGAPGQPVFPWRGRIRPGSLDKSAAARTGINALFGAAQADDFSVSGTSVTYTGPAGWGLNRMILHYAHLAKAAGGVSSFLIGSEMRGLTCTRDGAGAYPAVEKFIALAAQVRAVLGPFTEISYAADWSEYASYQPDDGTGDVLFPLDALWADSNIDFIGIDNYMPLADWRDGHGHLDAQLGWRSAYEIAYLQCNIRGGEGYDWFYASDADRAAQIRTPIDDTAHGEAHNEDWVFRPKDLWNWWANTHHERPGGARSPSPTAFTPRAKPIRFTELGCAAIDKAANQPNVFFDPKSSESALPHFSSGNRDDFIQRRLIEAHLSFWAETENNPVSPVYGGPMVDVSGIYLYAWDARPFPDFPGRVDLWSDGDNWTFGHWLNGRAGRVPLGQLTAAIAGRTGLTQIETGALQGLVTGYVIDRPMSPRAALEPLLGLYQVDAMETATGISFVPRGAEAALTIPPGRLVAGEGEPFELTLAQAGDLPAALEIAYLDDGQDYALSVAGARQDQAISRRTVSLDAPVIMEAGEAEGRARALIADALVMARSARLSLPPSLLALEPTDVIALALPEGAVTLRVGEILDGQARQVEAVATAPGIYGIDLAASRRRIEAPPASFGAPIFELVDLPLLGPGDTPSLYAAAYASPWPGGIAVYRETGGEPVLEEILEAPARMGRLAAALPGGPTGRWDRASSLRIRLSSGALSSAAEENVLAGANGLAVQSATGGWEVLRFATASLQPDGSWLLTDLLRGLAGTEEEAAAGASDGARAILLSGAVEGFPLPVEARLVPATRLAGPRQYPPQSDAYVTRTDTPQGLGWRPRSPVHLRAEKATGGIAIGWIRRTRIGGDNWEIEDVPLGEDSELYDVDILDGESLKRTLVATTPSIVWTDAMMVEDFPGGGTATIRVAQRSAIFGRGSAAAITVTL